MTWEGVPSIRVALSDCPGTGGSAGAGSGDYCDTPARMATILKHPAQASERGSRSRSRSSSRSFVRSFVRAFYAMGCFFLSALFPWLVFKLLLFRAKGRPCGPQIAFFFVLVLPGGCVQLLVVLACPSAFGRAAVSAVFGCRLWGLIDAQPTCSIF